MLKDLKKKKNSLAKVYYCLAYPKKEAVYSVSNIVSLARTTHVHAHFLFGICSWLEKCSFILVKMVGGMRENVIPHRRSVHRYGRIRDFASNHNREPMIVIDQREPSPCSSTSTIDFNNLQISKLLIAAKSAHRYVCPQATYRRSEKDGDIYRINNTPATCATNRRCHQRSVHTTLSPTTPL